MCVRAVCARAACVWVCVFVCAACVGVHAACVRVCVRVCALMRACVKVHIFTYVCKEIGHVCMHTLVLMRVTG